jgi:hypothetical protein
MMFCFLVTGSPFEPDAESVRYQSGSLLRAATSVAEGRVGEQR